MKGKFGRILGDFKTINGDTVTEILMNEGHAVAYNGGSKDDVVKQHLLNRQRLVNEGKVPAPEGISVEVKQDEPTFPAPTKTTSKKKKSKKKK